MMSFICLKENLTYEDSIRFTLLQGGDTDTNACIVGALLGACVGYSSLPQEQVNKMLSCDISKGKKSMRPKFL